MNDLCCFGAQQIYWGQQFNSLFVVTDLQTAVSFSLLSVYNNHPFSSPLPSRPFFPPLRLINGDLVAPPWEKERKGRYLCPDDPVRPQLRHNNEKNRRKRQWRVEMLVAYCSWSVLGLFQDVLLILWVMQHVCCDFQFQWLKGQYVAVWWKACISQMWVFQAFSFVPMQFWHHQTSTAKMYLSLQRKL